MLRNVAEQRADRYPGLQKTDHKSILNRLRRRSGERKSSHPLKETVTVIEDPNAACEPEKNGNANAGGTAGESKGA